MPDANLSTRIILGRTRDRLTGFASDAVGESYRWATTPYTNGLAGDISGPALRTSTSSYRGPTDGRIESRTDFPDFTNDQVAIAVNGLPVALTDVVGALTLYAYDALLHLEQTDSCTGDADTNAGPVVVSAQADYDSGTPLLQRQKERNAVGACLLRRCEGEGVQDRRGPVRLPGL